MNFCSSVFTALGTGHYLSRRGGGGGGGREIAFDTKKNREPDLIAFIFFGSPLLDCLKNSGPPSIKEWLKMWKMNILHNG